MRAVSGTVRAVSGTMRVVSETARAVSGTVRAGSGTVRAGSGNVRAGSGTVCAVSGNVCAVSETVCAVSATVCAAGGQGQARCGKRMMRTLRPSFEKTVDAVVEGDVETLRSMLRDDPDLVRERSPREHRATLLHYVAANGVEDERQRTPANALAVAKTLLDAGAEVDALADMYESEATTMEMLVSSAHPAAAGLQAALAELLLDRGADINRRGKQGQTPVVTALAFGYLDTAEALAKRGASLSFEALAGLGLADEVRRALPLAEAAGKHAALCLAAQHGHAAVVELLLDSGEDPNRYNPPGYHAHSTPLHQAVAAGHIDVVKLLTERGARLDIRDRMYDGTPLDWAIYLKKEAIAAYLMDSRPTSPSSP